MEKGYPPMRALWITTCLLALCACVPPARQNLNVHTKEGTLHYVYPQGRVTETPPAPQ